MYDTGENEKEMDNFRDTMLFVRNVLKKVSADQVRAHAAEAAFFSLMSSFPVLMLLMAMLKYTAISPDTLMSALETMMPPEMRNMIEPLVDSIYSQSAALISGTAAAAIWMSGKSVLGMADGLNVIYRIENTENYFLMRLRAAVYILVLVAALGLSVAILAVGYHAGDLVSERVSLFQHLPNFGMIILTALAMVILVVLFLLMYSYLPGRRKRLSSQLPGAVFASVSWGIFSFAFSRYLNYSTRMSVIYGSLATLVAVMLWLYVCMYLWFIGAEINHYLEKPELFSPDAISQRN